MKRIGLLKYGGWIVAVCILVILVRFPLQAQAAKTLPSVETLNGTFSSQNLPEDGSTLTLVRIPFSVVAPAKLQITSLIDAQFGGGGCCGQGGTVVTETCSLVLDSSTTLFTTAWSSNASLPASLSMTATDSDVPAGSHVLTVQCTGSTDTGSPGETVLARSGGTSLLVISGV
ncbi:hypothetical protein [Dictyobacter aurantiacus]|uniref:hypothetical protein n=1 Tax=Dictyobacter aurantiacus TaxID=1936993 RepID=UPI000F844E12|nr:hypothetical protein [Dictyobacter aurantiacus]